MNLSCHNVNIVFRLRHIIDIVYFAMFLQIYVGGSRECVIKNKISKGTRTLNFLESHKEFNNYWEKLSPKCSIRAVILN
jgi:hypothetical protein